MSYKRDCINSMKYFLKIAPIYDRIYFCPDIKGDSVVIVSQTWFSPLIYFTKKLYQLYGNYKKPNPGMLNLASGDYITSFDSDYQMIFYHYPENNKFIYIGDMGSDKLAFENSGNFTDFIHVKDGAPKL